MIDPPTGYYLDSHDLFPDPMDGPPSMYERWTCARCDLSVLVNGDHRIGEAMEAFCKKPRKRKS